MNSIQCGTVGMGCAEGKIVDENEDCNSNLEGCEMKMCSLSLFWKIFQKFFKKSGIIFGDIENM